MYEKIAGCLFGMALGDALAAPTEFLAVEAILRRWPPAGPDAPPGNPALVTDDTQMALAVGQALLGAPRPYQPQTLGPLIAQAFVEWLDDPRNNRAPGRTCLQSARGLKSGLRWQEATAIGSKGCGANMRVQPVGLLPEDIPTQAALAQFQAAFTHGHPTGLAAADMTAWVIAYLLHGGDVARLTADLRDYSETQRRLYHADWLGDLYTRAHGVGSAEQFIERGWQECLQTLDRVEAALALNQPERDPCKLVGEGWIAEEALAAALYCFLLYPDDPEAVMRRAAVSSGDSDSIACIAGAFAGVRCGLSALPQEWLARIEYREELEALAAGLSAMW